nr:MarR family transcriptional regulator [Actinomycetales bacterium]
MEVNEALDRDLVQTHGLSLNEYEVMVVLSEQPERRIRMSALAEEIVNSRSRLTHTIRRMERRGLVSREACADDGRGVNCILTDEGYAVLERAAPDHVDSVRRNIFDNITAAEARSLGAILGKLGESRHA